MLVSVLAGRSSRSTLELAGKELAPLCSSKWPDFSCSKLSYALVAKEHVLKECCNTVTYFTTHCAHRFVVTSVKGH